MELPYALVEEIRARAQEKAARNPTFTAEERAAMKKRRKAERDRKRDARRKARNGR